MYRFILTCRVVNSIRCNNNMYMTTVYNVLFIFRNEIMNHFGEPILYIVCRADCDQEHSVAGNSKICRLVTDTI